MTATSQRAAAARRGSPARDATRPSPARPASTTPDRGAGPGPLARELLELQRTAGNRAVTSLVASVQRGGRRIPIASGGGSSGGRVPIASGGGDGAATDRGAPAAVEMPTGGTEVDLVGVVDQDATVPAKSDGRTGLNFRRAPNTSDPPIGRLDDRDHLVAKRDMGGGWMYVIATNGHTWGGGTRGGRLQGTAGYVKTSNAAVNFSLPPDPSQPDPGAFLYRIPAGKRAHALVREVYGASNIETGQDQRFFTNVLKYINDGAKRGDALRSKTKTVKAGDFAYEKEDIELIEGQQIWIPSLPMAQSLKGTVSRGSRMRDIAERVKGWLKTAAAVPVFLAGLIVGAVESIRDFFVGLFDLVWNAIKTKGASLVDAARAIYDLVTDPRKRHDMLEAIAGELEKMVGDSVSFLRRWYNWGRIIGYATMEVVSTILTAGAIKAVSASRWGTKLARLTTVVSELGPVKKIASGARAIRDSEVGAKIAKAVKPVGETAKKVGGAVETVTGAPGRAVLKAADVLAERAGKLSARYGWSAERLVDASGIMRRRGVKLYLRKSTAHAPRRMAEGAVAKPMAIKANTLNELDVIIGSGFREEHLGLVAHFDPLPASKWKRPKGMSRQDWRRLQPALRERAAKRSKSFAKLDDEMKRLATPGRHEGDVSYRVEGGLVKEVEVGERGQEIVRGLTGDVDVFHATKADGSKLGSAYDRLDDDLLEAGLTEHGFHSQWPGRKDFDPDAFYSIIESHLDDPLIEIGPDLIAREVRADQIPEIAEILGSPEYKAWKQARMQKTAEAGASAAKSLWKWAFGGK